MADKAPVEAVLFDMDGTLLNSWDALVGSYHDATRSVLGEAKPVDREALDELIQLRAREAFPQLAGGDPELAARIEAVFGQSYIERAAQIDLYGGVREMLEALHGQGVRLGIATSKSRVRLDRDLERTQIEHLIDATICGDEVPAAKPDPRPLIAAMELLGVTAERTLFVGDGANDVNAAHGAGTRAVGAGYGFHPASCRAAGPELWIEAPAELPELVAALRGTD